MKVKKSLVTVLSMTLGLAVNMPVFAETVGTGDQDVDVHGRYQDSTTVPTVYSVDVSWGSMEFIYTESGALRWNPADHSYVDETSGFWTANGNAVTVVNHSNEEVTASFSFAPLGGYESVTGTFDVSSKALKAGEEGKYDEADKVTTALTLTGTLGEETATLTKIGSITVSIE